VFQGSLNFVIYIFPLILKEIIIYFSSCFKPLNAELNPICHLLALLGTHHILHVGRIRVNSIDNKLLVLKCYTLLVVSGFQEMN